MKGKQGRKQANELGDEPSGLLRSLLEVSGLLVVVTDLNARICLFNRACEELTGRSADEVIGRDVRDLLIPPEEQESVAEVFDALVRDGGTSRNVNHWLAHDGSRRLIEWRNAVLADEDGGPRYVIGTGLDITGHRQAEVARQQRERQLRELVDAMPVLVAELDTEHCIRFANSACWEWFGLDPETQTGRHMRETIGADAYALLAPHYNRALAGERVSFDGEIPYQHGGSRIVHARYFPSHDDEGNIDGLYILAIDFTERERLRRRLITESRRSSTVLDTAVDGIITIDEHGIIQSFNRAAERMFGWRAGEVIGRNVRVLMPEPDRSRHDGYLRHYLETGERHIIGIGREVTALHRDGSQVDVELAVGEFSDEGQRYFTGFTRDIRDRKRAEHVALQRLEQLSRVTRLHAMGELASGLAHEVNQPLTAIHATAEAGLAMLESESVEPEQLGAMLHRIAQQGKRASRVIEQLRGFLRTHQPGDRTECDPNKLVRDVLPLLSHEVEACAVEIHLDLDPDVPAIAVNEVQMEQVIFNVVKNGVEAMGSIDEERRLEICTRYHEDDERACEIMVTNTGPCIPSEHLPRLFEPFFSTKTDGMGQGLAISRSIVEAHDGNLEAENLPGRGVCFHIRLPLGPEVAQ